MEGSNEPDLHPGGSWNQVAGTVWYSAGPVAVLQLAVSFRTDLWGLGTRGFVVKEH